MAAIATERFSEQKCTRDITGNWTATRGWDVIGYVSEDDAINATGVLVGASHPLTSSLVCTKIGLTENKLTKGVVIANYAVSTIIANDPNPLIRVPVVSWKWGKQSLPIDTDINGNPILNSATDAFRSNATRNFSVRFLRISRWEPYYNEALASQYVDTTNSGAVVLQGITRQPGQVYLLSYAPIEEYQVGAPYVHVAYEFEIRTPNTSGLTSLQIRYPFQLRLLDQGLRAQYQDPNNNNTKTLGNLWLGGQNTQQCNRDVLLNGQGQPMDSTIAVTQMLYTATSQTLPSTVMTDKVNGATFLIYMIYAEQDLTALGVS
jgi:hypothetical protein